MAVSTDNDDKYPCRAKILIDQKDWKDGDVVELHSDCNPNEDGRFLPTQVSEVEIALKDGRLVVTYVDGQKN